MAVAIKTASDPLSALAHWAETRPNGIAVRTEQRTISYQELQCLVSDAAAQINAASGERCAIFMDNGLGWIVADLALRRTGSITVPVPGYFSDTQIDHVLRRAGVDLVITDVPESLGRSARRGFPPSQMKLSHDTRLQNMHLLSLEPIAGGSKPSLPTGTCKLTFTSGTTGQPKGVCLSDAVIDQVSEALLVATEGNSHDRHLSVLPYPALLENIAGIYVTLMAGAEICSLPLASLGFAGSSGLQPAQLVAALDLYRPTSIVTVPQILQVLMQMSQKAGWRQDYLRHVAVGGASLPLGAVQMAQELGLPVYEGYGLSECGSVVTLNTRTHQRPGSVGRALPHCSVTLAADGEVMVAGAQALGYLDAGDDFSCLPAGPVATGDLGRFDADGYLYLLGRKKNMFITSFGRNVSPEWVECELAAMPSIGQAFVFGEARPWNVALILPRAEAQAQGNDAWKDLVAADIAAVNDRLPDYARIRRWLIADQPFLPNNDLLTWNGRLRRRQITTIYQDRIDRMYEEDLSYVF